jgi:bifunctional DNase/RNase
MLTATLLLYGSVSVAGARELAIDAAQAVEVEIATVAIAKQSGAPVVVLREPGTGRFVPIFIGPLEAQAILRGMRGLETPRPLTHDLIGNVLGGLGVRLARVFVDDIVDNTYLGMLELHIEGRDAPVLVDSRPSDALALALRSGASIHVARKVMEAASRIAVEALPDHPVASALGITVVPLTADLREALQLPDLPGVLVSGVSGPAQAAGMRPGALLLEVNGNSPASPMAFLEQVRDTPGGEQPKLSYWQDGVTHELVIPADVRSPAQRQAPARPQLAL